MIRALFPFCFQADKGTGTCLVRFTFKWFAFNRKEVLINEQNKS